MGETAAKTALLFAKKGLTLTKVNQDCSTSTVKEPEYICTSLSIYKNTI